MCLLQSEHWKCENTESVGSLWVRMCRFFAVEYDTREHVINIRQRKLMKRGEKKWTRRLPLEDPFMRKRSVTRSLSHTAVFEYIYDRLRALYFYFTVPCNKDGPLIQVCPPFDISQFVFILHRCKMMFVCSPLIWRSLKRSYCSVTSALNRPRRKLRTQKGTLHAKLHLPHRRVTTSRGKKWRVWSGVKKGF